MKWVIKKILAKLGFELVLKSLDLTRPSMTRGLGWLRDHEFKIATVLDVGASNGCWSKSCMSYFPEAQYVLFEPQPVHSDALDAFKKECSQKITLVKKAVGRSEGITFFDATDPFSGALADKKDDAGNTIEVSLTAIDACLADLQINGPYLLKLDTHGYERSILEGASSTLDKCEVLIIEAYNYRISGEVLLFWELCAFLHERGFRPVDLVDVRHRLKDGSLWQMDLIFAKSTWKGFDYNGHA